MLTVKGSTSVKQYSVKRLQKQQVLEYENYAEAFTALKSGKGDTLTTDDAILLRNGRMRIHPSNIYGRWDFTDEPCGMAVKRETLSKMMNE